MTTVIYHQGILATDSRASATTENMTCSHCDHEKPNLVRNKGSKIQLLKPGQARWFGESLKLAAFAGNAMVISRLRHILTGTKNDFEFSEALNIIRDMGLLSQVEDVTALFVTSNAVHKIVHKVRDPNPAKHTRYDLDDTVAIGSGGGCARAAALFMGLGTLEAVAVAMVADDPFSGGDIYWVDTNGEHRVNKTEMTPIGLELLRVGYQDILGTLE